MCSVGRLCQRSSPSAGSLEATWCWAIVDLQCSAVSWGFVDKISQVGSPSHLNLHPCSERTCISQSRVAVFHVSLVVRISKVNHGEKRGATIHITFTYVWALNMIFPSWAQVIFLKMIREMCCCKAIFLETRAQERRALAELCTANKFCVKLGL